MPITVGSPRANPAGELEWDVTIGLIHSSGPTDPT